MTLRRTLAAAALVVTAWSSSDADVPMLLNYQGHLTDASGNPENGLFTMDFAVFDAESGGNQLWGETQSVQVTDGVFNVLLGSVTPLPADLFTGGPSDSFGPRRYLQVTVSGETLGPLRKRIASVAYAISAAGGGAACWDLNQNGACDPNDPIEDRNQDGSCTIADCTVAETVVSRGLGTGTARAHMHVGEQILIPDDSTFTLASTDTSNGQVGGAGIAIIRVENGLSGAERVAVHLAYRSLAPDFITSLGSGGPTPLTLSNGDVTGMTGPDGGVTIAAHHELGVSSLEIENRTGAPVNVMWLVMD